VEWQQRTAEWKQNSAPPVGKQPEVADSGKAARQDMLGETPQKLLMRQRHDAALTAVGIVVVRNNFR
jgi:hypothetical protein